jgi:nitrous oxidase accessory protein NosD
MGREIALTGILVLALGAGGPAEAVDLFSLYLSAGPGEGYDKLLVLDPSETYTGGIWVENGVRCCVHGNGATITLWLNSMLADGAGSVLDIDHCILIGGDAGVYISNGATGVIRNNTIRGNQNGIRSFQGDPGLLIENNIIVENVHFGIHVTEDYEPMIRYNTVWGHVEGNYMMRGC